MSILVDLGSGFRGNLGLGLGRGFGVGEFLKKWALTNQESGILNWGGPGV